MKESKGTVMFIATLILLYEGVRGVFNLLVECSRYLNVELNLSWSILAVFTSIITITLFVVGAKLIVNTSRSFIKAILFFCASYILLIIANQQIGIWLSSLEQTAMIKAIEGEQAVAYSNHIYLFLTLISLVILSKVKLKKQEN